MRLFWRIVAVSLCAAASWAQTDSGLLTSLERVERLLFSTTPATLNDIWGVRGPDGTPYFLVGTSNGTAIFEVSDPSAPNELRFIPGPVSNWRDIKTFVYEDDPNNFRAFAFTVTEGTPGGLQITDLSNLPEIPAITDTYNGISTAHNLFIQPNHSDPTVYAAVTGGRIDSGLVLIDISDPNDPQILSRWDEIGVHDVYVSSTWADPAYNGRDIAVAFCERGYIAIIDVSDKTAPQTIQRIRYDGLSYSHSGWVDPSGRYLYAADELDEIREGTNTRLFMFDLLDLSAPQDLGFWEGPNTSTEHNLIAEDSYIFVSHYTRGLVVLDTTNPEEPVEVANFDTQIGNDFPGFNGAWGVYIFEGLDLIGISDDINGLYVVQFNRPPLKLRPDRAKLGLVPGGNAEAVLIAELGPGGQLPNEVMVSGLPAGVQLNEPINFDESGRASFQLSASADVQSSSGQITFNAAGISTSLDLTVSARPRGPVLGTPVNGDIWKHPNDLTMQWEADPALTEFELVLENLDTPEEDAVVFKSSRNRFSPVGKLAENTRYQWFVRSTDAAGTLHQSPPATFSTGRPPMLLIDDAGFFSQLALNYDAWLDGLNVPRDTYNPLSLEFNSIANGDSPRGIPSEMPSYGNYPFILWSSGENRTVTETPLSGPNPDEEILLTQYLANGGALMMDGRDYLHDVGEPTAFMNDVLGIGQITGDVAEFQVLNGAGSLAGLGTFTLGAIRGGNFEDRMVPSRAAQAALIDEASGDAAAIETANTLFFSFSFDRLIENRPVIAEEILLSRYSNALNVDLAMKKMFRLVLPVRTEDLTDEIWLSVTDTSSSEQTPRLTAIDAQGRALSIALPSLPANGQIRVPLDSRLTGFGMPWNWLLLDSDGPVIAHVEGRGDDRAYATPLTAPSGETLFIPHIAADTGSFFTRANVVNASPAAGTLELNSFGGETFPLDGGGPFQGTPVDFVELFGGNIDAGRTAATANGIGMNLAGAEIFGTQAGDQLAGLTLRGSASQTLFFSHIANVPGGWWTGLAIVNPGDIDAGVNLIARDSAGQVVAESALVLTAGSKILTLVNEASQANELFPEGLPASAVSLEVNADQPITGYELFGDAPNRQLAGLQAGHAPLRDFILPVAGNADYWSGLAFVNPGGEALEANLRLFGANGIERDTATVTIEPGARFLTLTSAIFSSLPEQGYLRISSEADMYGFQLFGPNSFEWLAGLNGFPVP